jgi:hypothetical protein
LRCIIVLSAWLASTALAFGAEAGNLAALVPAMGPIMGNLRTAASYARTGNIALAQMENEEAVAAWKKLQETAAVVALPGDELAEFLAAGGARLAAITQALDGGDNAAARHELLALRQSFHELRRRSGFYDLGVCVFEIAPAMENLRVAAARFGEQPTATHAGDAIATAGAFRDRLQRCNDWASAEVSAQVEFRRLIDGAIASSGEIARAVMSGDAPLVHRYLIELQSYAQLLDFHYG